MATRSTDGRGSATWVRTKLTALSENEDWAAHAASADLINWLYVIVQQRARTLAVSADARADIVQDTMTPLVRALNDCRTQFAAAGNPAAVLERVAARAVGESRHRLMMCGMSAVQPNGQNWRARYPRRIGGDAGRHIIEEQPNPDFDLDPAIERAAVRTREWVSDNLDVCMSADAEHALVYVLDRLVAGVSRAALVRGGHSALRSDPALRHLGFSPGAASAFGLWLLGRRDTQHGAASVLDAAIAGDPVDHLTAQRWRRDALRFGFAHPAASAAA